MEKQFLRQQWFKHPRLGKKWRRPRGKQSKLRKGYKGHWSKPSVGFSKDRKLRGLVKGYITVAVESLTDVENIQKGYAIIIAGCVGKKKALAIEKKANEKGIKIINEKKIYSAKHLARKIEERKKLTLESKKKVEEKKTESKEEKKA